MGLGGAQAQQVGFERTASSAWAPTATVCIALLVLNLLDGLFTLSFLQLGLAEEANPLMRMAYERSPVMFMGSKLAIVHAGVLMLWVNRNAAAARAALQVGVLLYGAIVAYHLSFLLAVVAA
jgi:hypothetical protein